MFQRFIRRIRTPSKSQIKTWAIGSIFFWIGSVAIAQPDFGYERCRQGGGDSDNEYCYWVAGIADPLNAKARQQYRDIQATIADGRRFNQFRRELVPLLQFLSQHPEAQCVDAFRSTIPELACTHGREPNRQVRIFRNLISLDVNSGPNSQVVTPIEQMNEELRAFRENEKNRYEHLAALQGDGSGNLKEPTQNSNGTSLPNLGLTSSSGGQAVSDGNSNSGSSDRPSGNGSGVGASRPAQTQGGFTQRASNPSSVSSSSGSTSSSQSGSPTSSQSGFGTEHQIKSQAKTSSPYSQYAQSFGTKKRRSSRPSSGEALVFAAGEVDVVREVASESKPLDSQLNFTPSKKASK